ncbi:MAG TPA: cytochrome c3 family protein [Gemmataceae bacterium]|nr:cytochrome c3 family protein [Gemmataceae bacterium]
MAGPSINRERAAPFRGQRRYFHRPTAIRAWRVRLAVLALLVTGGWVAALTIDRDVRQAACTHGELARVHAPWADKCDACHVPHSSTSSAGSGLFDTRDRWRTFRCETCHAGPPHDPKNFAPHYDRMAKPHLVDDAQARDCSSCHHDHQGADFALARVNDSDCTRCHKDLSPLHGSSPNITAFHKDHPDFRVKQSPPMRGLKFNHALHLTTGITEKTNLDNPNAVFKLGQVGPAYREQYRRFAGSENHEAALRLDCAACHEPAGGGYKSVSFDRHCQGCHAQTVSGLQSAAGVTTKPFTIPHGRPNAEQNRWIRSEILRQVEDQKQILRTVPFPPTDRLDSPRVALPSDLSKEADELVKLAGRLLSCQKCHETSEGQIRPTGTPAQWLPGARFDHTAHRAVNCAECHNTWGSTIARGGGSEPLNVPGIDNCRQCHAPARVVKGVPSGGARHDCVECHRYHAVQREPPDDRRLPIESFLRGNRNP